MSEAVVQEATLFDARAGKSAAEHLRLTLKQLDPNDRERELIVVNPRPSMEKAMVGVLLDIRQDAVYVGGVPFARRLGFRRVELVDPPPKRKKSP